jgi:hypothetical protein
MFTPHSGIYLCSGHLQRPTAFNEKLAAAISHYAEEASLIDHQFSAESIQ